jgi:hypothetical protein
VPGTRSRKTAESTGILPSRDQEKYMKSHEHIPPTPMPKTAIKEARAMKFGAPPEARPNTPVINKVRLNDHLELDMSVVYIESKVTYFLPQMSQPNDQKIAPTHRPTFEARARNGPLN